MHVLHVDSMPDEVVDNGKGVHPVRDQEVQPPVHASLLLPLVKQTDS
jgi:hypothetical protein